VSLEIGGGEAVGGDDAQAHGRGATGSTSAEEVIPAIFVRDLLIAALPEGRITGGM